MADKRPKPSGVATTTDQERVDLFKTMLAYSGTYDFDGKIVTHHIELSGNPALAGTNQVRNVTLDGRRLVLNYTAPAPSTGVVSKAEVTLEKVD